MNRSTQVNHAAEMLCNDRFVNCSLCGTLRPREDYQQTDGHRCIGCYRRSLDFQNQHPPTTASGIVTLANRTNHLS